jgi:hypothetical protein
MNQPPPPADPGRTGQRTRAGDLPQPGAPRPHPHPQPPLREVLKGLDVRELEGETVFDQLFGLPSRSAR